MEQEKYVQGSEDFFRDLKRSMLSLPSTSKNHYLSAMHVSRTPEY